MAAKAIERNGGGGGPHRDHRKYSINPNHQLFMTNEIQQMQKKVSKGAQRVSISHAINTSVRQKLYIVLVCELLFVILDCLLCIAFSSFNEKRDSNGLLHKLASIRKLLDFWAFYILGLCSLAYLFKAAGERDRDKILPFLGWKCATVAMNGIGLISFGGAMIYVETRKQRDYQAFRTLIESRTWIAGYEVDVKSLLILAIVKTWIGLSVGIVILIFTIKLRRLFTYSSNGPRLSATLSQMSQMSENFTRSESPPVLILSSKERLHSVTFEDDAMKSALPLLQKTVQNPVTTESSRSRSGNGGPPGPGLVTMDGNSSTSSTAKLVQITSASNNNSNMGNNNKKYNNSNNNDKNGGVGVCENGNENGIIDNNSDPSSTKKQQRSALKQQKQKAEPILKNLSPAIIDNNQQEQHPSTSAAALENSKESTPTMKSRRETFVRSVRESFRRLSGRSDRDRNDSVDSPRGDDEQRLPLSRFEMGDDDVLEDVVTVVMNDSNRQEEHEEDGQGEHDGGPRQGRAQEDESQHHRKAAFVLSVNGTCYDQPKQTSHRN